MQPIAALTTMLFVLCAALIMGARTIGHTGDMPPVYLETGDCQQPCWQGFKPGSDLDTNALIARIMELPYSVGRISEYSGGYFPMFEIYPSGNLVLADLMRTWGAPERVGCLQQVPQPNERTLGTVYYFDGLVAAQLVAPAEEMRVTPQMRVGAIQYYQPGDPVYAIGETTAWYGFAGSPVYAACYAAP